MVHAYSKRLLSPFTGQVQVVEMDPVRALSLDGVAWEIQFMHSERPGRGGERAADGKLMRRRYVRIANIKGSEVQRLATQSFFEFNQVDAPVRALADYLQTVELPFSAADHYEYWLLDGRHESPLALIYSTVNEEDLGLYPNRPEWTALSSAMMEIKRLPEEQQDYIPPVNYRLERLVSERAGKRPQAVWFKRSKEGAGDFPPCLVSEHWENEADHRLCQRYIERQAPRLLMLHGLSRSDRLRLEGAARENASEVERFYPLYPEVADEPLMSAIRVEARLRRSN